MSNQEDILIMQASIKEDMFCHYSYSVDVAPGITDRHNVKSQLPIHDDMKNAFRKLNSHLAVICEEVHNLEVNNIDRILVRPDGVIPDDYEKSLEGIDKKLYAFVATAIQFDGTGENAGVIIIGKKKLSTGDWLHLTSPKITWDSTSYFFINELRIAADDIAYEVKEYMEGKQAPKIIQTEMEFPEEEQEEEEYQPKKKKARKGSKENPVTL